jgi:predicted glycoside hydrolase/deacetylase ChbG (UPF0249 family)
MRKLIINADDFGLSLGTNEAIAELLCRGAITSTTLMANGPALEDAVECARRSALNGMIGLHANLTQFAPSGEGEGLSSIRDSGGQYAGRRALFKACARGLVKAEALHRELAAQWRACESRGLSLSHVDTHQHAHLVPAVFRAAQQLASEKGVPLRRLWPGGGARGMKRKLMHVAVTGLTRINEFQNSQRQSTSMELVSIFASGEKPTVAAYRALLEKSCADVVELMVHPAKVDRVHRESTGISEISQLDYEVLGSPEWLDYLASCGFALVSFRELTGW